MSIGKLVCLSVLITISFDGFGQDHSSVATQWTSTQTIHPGNNTVTENTMLILKGRTRMEWRNPNGTIRKSFDVIEIVGMSPQKDGDQMRLEVIEAGKRGYVLNTLTSGQLKAELSIDYQQPQIYQLSLVK